MNTRALTQPVPVQEPLAGLSFRRNPTLEVHRINAGLLLRNPATAATRRLDPLEAAVWYLLKDPTTVEEAVRAMQRTFPDRDPAGIRSRVEQLFRDLLAASMILGGERSSARNAK